MIIFCCFGTFAKDRFPVFNGIFAFHAQTILSKFVMLKCTPVRHCKRFEQYSYHDVPKYGNKLFKLNHNHSYRYWISEVRLSNAPDRQPSLNYKIQRLAQSTTGIQPHSTKKYLMFVWGNFTCDFNFCFP